MALKEVGRNDQCPCGSGRKYKACCLKKNIAVPRGIAGVEIAFHLHADHETVTRLAETHGPTLIASIEARSSSGQPGTAVLTADGYCLLAYDKASAEEQGIVMKEEAAFYFFGMPDNCELAVAMRTEMAGQKDLWEADPETFEPVHNGEFVDFYGMRGFYYSERVPFFRMRNIRKKDDSGAIRIQSAFFSGAGRTAHIWKQFKENNEESFLCVDIYEQETNNDFGLELLGEIPIRWELEFELEWPRANVLPRLGITACTILDPNALDPMNLSAE